ncbi:MAG: hypothetical protein KY450_04915 [Actinobacteria bacterium]|nr:hypothetical protein [Actinomycetota bacterium]
MEDREVIEALVVGGARQAFGSALHIEGDLLVLDGWWEAAFRVAPTTFAVRDEPPPGGSTVLDDVAAELVSRGLAEVAADPSLLFAITYTDIDLGPVDWKLWSTDPATAEAALAARAGHDTFLGDAAVGGARLDDYAAELGGARRSAGLPALMVLTVGVDADAVEAMVPALDDCRIESRALGELAPGDCAASMANLVLLDATSDAGRHFLAEVRASPGGRVLPVVAISRRTDVEGADASVDAAAHPLEWAEHLRNLLP